MPSFNQCWSDLDEPPHTERPYIHTHTERHSESFAGMQPASAPKKRYRATTLLLRTNSEPRSA